MKLGVLALQGDVSEHVRALERATAELDIGAVVLELRSARGLDELDALLMPGGESTAIARQMRSSGLWEAVVNFSKAGKPIMGTCAGCVLLSKGVEGAEDPTLGLMDIQVRRNAFGRQRESFETQLRIEGLDDPFPGVFIRAPAITDAWGRARVLAELEGKAVMARQDNLLALSFHPELVNDFRVHSLFLGSV
jgi:5'-phosphate synthase pdxT subunit